MLLRSTFPMCKKSMFPQWAVAWSAFCMGLGVDLAHSCYGLSEHPCFFSNVIYWTGVAVKGRMLLSAIGLRADWLQDKALISRLSSLCTMAGVVPFYLKVPKAVFPSQRLRHETWMNMRTWNDNGMGTLLQHLHPSDTLVEHINLWLPWTGYSIMGGWRVGRKTEHTRERRLLTRAGSYTKH